MNATKGTDIKNAALLNTRDLQKYLSCGRPAATAIGIKAEARIQEGRRVLWSKRKIDNYIYSLLECEVNRHET